MEGKWLKATIVLASTLGSTYLALMQRSECVIKTEAHTIDMDLNEQDYWEKYSTIQKASEPQKLWLPTMIWEQ